MDRKPSLVARTRPYSFSALVIAAACLGIATILRVAFGWIGVNLPFATYFPAVLVASLLAGIPAGVGVILGSIVIVWWAFLPPLYDFGTLTAADVANFLVYIVSSGCIVALAKLYRDGLHQLAERDRERELLVQELQHRGRNTYAVVEAIVRNTLVNDRASADAIAGRVRAVSSANDLVNQSNTKTVQLRALLSLEFAPNADQRLHTSGPDIELSPDVARKAGLVFHELATNAMKHGALSNSVGRVLAEWQLDGTAVRLLWKEQGGPPVAPPQRRGFGTVIVTESLKSLAGDIAFAFNPDGLLCDMTFDCR